MNKPFVSTVCTAVLFSSLAIAPGFAQNTTTPPAAAGTDQKCSPQQTASPNGTTLNTQQTVRNGNALTGKLDDQPAQGNAGQSANPQTAQNANTQTAQNGAVGVDPKGPANGTLPCNAS